MKVESEKFESGFKYNTLTFLDFGVIYFSEVIMNSIRNLIEHLGSTDSINVFWPRVWKMDSMLLEKGFIFHNDFPESPFFTNEINELSWVVIFQYKPYFVSGFFIQPNKTEAKVTIRLREIKVGKKLPFTLTNSEYERISELSDIGWSFRLADCPQLIFDWLKEHEASEEIIDRISQPA